jgi:hypothetical protein
LKKRSSLYFCGVLSGVLAICVVMSSCGKNYYFAGRNLPPSKLLNRVLVAEQNPSEFATGALPFMDAFYDIRHAYNTSGGAFSISGYSGKLPLTIENLPEQQSGAVYNAGDGSLTLISYGDEKVSTSISIPGGLSSSAEASPYTGIAMSRDLTYVYAVNPQTHVVSAVNRAKGTSVALNLPNAYGISVNPGGTVALVFVENATQAAGQADDNSANPATFAVYSLVQLTTDQQAAAINNPNYFDPKYGVKAQDCEPQKLPTWCVFPVSTGAGATFDHPIKAVFSPDDTTAYVLNCGPECGGTTASLTTIPITGGSLNTGSIGASGIALVAQSNIPVPGGATNALFNGNTLYVAGQQLQPSSGLFGGNLTVMSMPSGTISGTYSISDGTHNRMVFADDNTLWIGSSKCQQGPRYQQAQAGGNIQFGCLTMFNTATNTATVGAFRGDATGIADVEGLHKVYTTEGGQLYIFKTTDMSELNNANVTLAGTAIDVAYMDAGSDANNTSY